LFLDTLCEWFPNAIILHIVRDPRAAVASLQRQAWASGSVVTNARQWRIFTQAARRFGDWPGYLEIRYEDLVIDPARELRGICAFLGEDYSPLMTVPDRNGTAGSDSPTRWQTEITSGRLSLWEKQLTAPQVAQIEWMLGPEMERFGYNRHASPASALTVLGGASWAALDFAGHVVTRLPALWRRFAAPTRMEKS
jgi:hypothetical protein